MINRVRQICSFLIGTALCAVLLWGCADTGRTLPSATGSIYEMLVVIDKAEWEAQSGAKIKEVMAADMPCLPQMESYFSLTQCSPQLFDNFLMPTRNILYVDVNPERYTSAKIRYARNQWSKPQAVCFVQSPNWDEFNELFNKQAENIRNWFVREELTRQGKFYQGYQTTETRKAAEKRFGIDIRIPEDYLLVRDTADLVWCVNDGGSLRRDLIIWSYPYLSQDQLCLDSLLSKRNEILGKNIVGSIQGTYMGTEYKHFPPIFTPISINDNWCAEVRGLWKMQGGEAMGGPFVQHTRIDELSHRLITAEVFIFAPGQKKRNPLRQAEAILYTIKLPQEINQLKEVKVSQPTQ